MQQHIEQLEAEGYTVFSQFLDTTTTARIRAHMDSLLPPVAPPEAENVPRVNTLRHPIPGAIMAEILARPPLVELAGELLHAQELRLLEQVLIRTDPQLHTPPASGWHVDMAFLPSHYEARPRQTYYHMVHCLSTVAPGGGAFTIVPGSHHQTYTAAAKLDSEAGLKEFKKSPAETAGIDVRQAVQVCAQEGDLLVFNPMALHSASANGTSQPRYVYFASFYDQSAAYLKGHLKGELKVNGANCRSDFPDSLRENLPAQLQFLLED